MASQSNNGGSDILSVWRCWLHSNAGRTNALLPPLAKMSVWVFIWGFVRPLPKLADLLKQVSLLENVCRKGLAHTATLGRSESGLQKLNDFL